MKIKTIRKQLDYAEKFDSDVNAALEDGWLLSRRTVLVPPTTDEHIMLYAELVKDLEPDSEAWKDAVQTLRDTCAKARSCDADECPAFEWCTANLATVPDRWRTPNE